MSHVLKPAFILFFIAVIITSTLGVVYSLTKEPIRQQMERTKNDTMKKVMPKAWEFIELEAQLSGNMVSIYEGYSDGEAIGYVIELSPAGYSGNIDMMVGISSVDNSITGMRVLRHTETPGLGANAVKESFYNQYNSKALLPLRVVKATPSENEIQAITSSTITTKAITDAVNEAIDWYNGGGAK